MIKVIKFSAPWCGPCKTLKPIWDAAVSKNTNSEIQYSEVDADSEPERAEEHGIRVVPTILVLRDDKEIGRIIGFKKDIEELILKQIES